MRNGGASLRSTIIPHRDAAYWLFHNQLVGAGWHAAYRAAAGQGSALVCSAGRTHAYSHAALLLLGVVPNPIPLTVHAPTYPLSFCLFVRCCSSCVSQNWNQDGTGLTITREEQIQYNRWVTETVSACAYRHKNMMSLSPLLHISGNTSGRTAWTT